MQKTYYAVITYKTGDNDYGVFFPEVENCFSTGESVEQAIINAGNALELHFGDWEWDYPLNKAFNDLNVKLSPDDGQVITIVPITVAVPGRKIRVNTTLDEYIVSLLDKKVRNRSAFIEKAIVEKLKTL